MNEIVKNEQFIHPLVKNAGETKLRDFLSQQVLTACVYRGINKSEEERAVISQMLVDEVKRCYSYLTTEQIAFIFRTQKYGSEYNKTVCPQAFISCLEAENTRFMQEINRNKEAEQQQQTKLLSQPQPQPKKTTRAERVEQARRDLCYCYERWVTSGQVIDYPYHNYLYISKILREKFSFSELKRLREKAREQEAKRQAKRLNPVKYKTFKHLLRDFEVMNSPNVQRAFKQAWKDEIIRAYFDRVRRGQSKLPL